MFPNGYFAPSYFAPVYFNPVGSELVVTILLGLVVGNTVYPASNPSAGGAASSNPSTSI